MNKYVLSRESLNENPILLKRYIDKFEIKKSLDGYVVMLVDLRAFISEELGYLKEENPLKVIFKNPAHRFKPINVIEEGDLYYCFMRDIDRADKFIEQIGKLSDKATELRERAEFLIKHHPKKFDVKAKLIKYQDMNLGELMEAIEGLQIDDVEQLSADNIRLDSLKVNQNAVENYIKEELYKNGVKRDYLKITHFYNMFCFSDRAREHALDFRILPYANNKASELFKHFFKSPWHKLGDKDFYNQIANELGHYLKFPESNTEKFISNNIDKIRQHRYELKEELYEMLENTTTSALLFDNETYHKRLKHYNFIKDNILNNERILNKSFEFKKLNDKYYYFQHQRYHFSQISNILAENDINNLEALLNMKAEKFFYIFDPNKEKKVHSFYIENEDKNASVRDIINSFENNDMNVLSKGQLYRIVLNDNGGTFLVLFDCIRILQSNANGFNIYQSLFSKDKVVDFEYQQKILSLIYLICNFLFDGELKCQYEKLIDCFLNDDFFTIKHIDYDNRLSEEENIERVKGFVKLKESLEEFTDYFTELSEILKSRPSLT